MTEATNPHSAPQLAGHTANKKAVVIDYTNWRGERRLRTIVPEELMFVNNKWHPEEQWLLRAFDVEQCTFKVFALRCINSWTVARATGTTP